MDNPELGGKFSTESSRPATVETVGVHRVVKVVGVLETELDTLASLNAQTTIWASVATALASLAAGIWITAAYTDKPTAEGNVLTHAGAPLLLVLTLVTGVLALISWHKRKLTIERLFGQSFPDRTVDRPR